MDPRMQTETQLETEWRLVKLNNAFAHYLDFRMFEELAALFIPEGIWDRVQNVHRGQNEILEGMRKRPSDVVMRHILTNFHFTHVSDTKVKGIVYLNTHHALSPGGKTPVAYDIGHSIVIDFHDVYQKTALGWRFAERIARPALLPSDSPMLKTEQR